MLVTVLFKPINVGPNTPCDTKAALVNPTTTSVTIHPTNVLINIFKFTP